LPAGVIESHFQRREPIRSDPASSALNARQFRGRLASSLDLAAGALRLRPAILTPTGRESRDRGTLHRAENYTFSSLRNDRPAVT
jgi:hypothetical protein